jgi:hypothetical protein
MEGFHSKSFNTLFHHFQDRLKYRYQLDISENEYMDLCKKQDFEILEQSNGRIKILIDFKGFTIKAVKQIQPEGFLLVTALNKLTS